MLRDEAFLFNDARSRSSNLLVPPEPERFTVTGASSLSTVPVLGLALDVGGGDRVLDKGSGDAARCNVNDFRMLNNAPSASDEGDDCWSPLSLCVCCLPLPEGVPGLSGAVEAALVLLTFEVPAEFAPAATTAFSTASRLSCSRFVRLENMTSTSRERKLRPTSSTPGKLGAVPYLATASSSHIRSFPSNLLTGLRWQTAQSSYATRSPFSPTQTYLTSCLANRRVRL